MNKILGRTLSMFEVIIKPFLKYTTVGGLATCIHYAIFIGVIRFLAWAPWQATLIASSVGALAAYHLNYHYTFSSVDQHRTLLPKFLAVAVLGVILQTLIVAVLSQQWQWHYLLAQIVATIFGLILTFSINRIWTFA